MENKGFILVNLLPYREKLKKEKIVQFSLLMGLFGVASLALIFVGHTFLSLQIDQQERRKAFIEKQNKELETQIKDIADLKLQIKDTLAKRAVVEALQVNRADGVNIFNTVAKALIEGTSIKEIKKVGNRVTIIGQTQSNAKVANYMTNLEETDVFRNPQLIEVRSMLIKQKNRRSNKDEEFQLNEFVITVDLEKPIVEEAHKTNNERTNNNQRKTTPAAK